MRYPTFTPRILVFLGLFFVVSLASVAAQSVAHSSEPRCTLSGKVTLTVSDLSGARIPNAFVLLRTNRWGKGVARPGPLELRTDSAGIVTGSVYCGYADLFVAADGFAPQARELLIEQTTSSVSVRLEVYPHTEQ